MCLLIVIAGHDPRWPLIVASNRDEARSRKAAPPGLWVGDRRRILSPRDRLAGGTWIGVNDLGLFAGLTNLGANPEPPLATSRGDITHHALDTDGLEPAVSAVRDLVTRSEYAGFQIVLSDGESTVVLEHESGGIVRRDAEDGVAVVGNQHRIGELSLPGLATALLDGVDVEERLSRLEALLLDTREHDGHRALKKGGEYGTVSSSLIARPAENLRGLVWRYAAGPPDEAPYRNYGNLARRLVEVI